MYKTPSAVSAGGVDVADGYRPTPASPRRIPVAVPTTFPSSVSESEPDLTDSLTEMECQVATSRITSV